jgi:glutamate/tyrosine decarboxylase-like PLP-dependent enzyme
MGMDYQHILKQRHTLDPENWEDLEALGIQMVKDMLGYLKNIKQDPAWKPIDQQTKSGFEQPVPLKPSSARDVYNRFSHDVLPYPTGNLHPRFWAWADGNGTPFTMLTEMLAAGMNPNVCAGEHSAMYVEQQVIDWLKEMMGFPSKASGILLSGGAMSNLTALLIARNSYSNQLIRDKGVNALSGNLVLYGSVETHSCVEKAADIMGLGRQALRKIPVNAAYQIDLAALAAAIKEDKANGNLPFCVVGNVGTVNTGSIDDLAGIHRICKKEGLWMHVDGAFGALAKLTDEYQELLKPLEIADSVAFDLHKWMYFPFGIACLLVKDRDLHKQAFVVDVNYLFKHERGLAGGPEIIADYGIEMSRGFKSLQVWMALQNHGLTKYAQLIRQNIALAQYLAHLLDETPALELLAPVALNVVCFRFNPGSISEAQLNALNQELLMQLQESGVAVPSYTILSGRYSLRVAVINHRSVKADMDILVSEVVKTGQALASTMTATQ